MKESFASLLRLLKQSDNPEAALNLFEEEAEGHVRDLGDECAGSGNSTWILDLGLNILVSQCLERDKSARKLGLFENQIPNLTDVSVLIDQLRTSLEE